MMGILDRSQLSVKPSTFEDWFMTEIPAGHNTSRYSEYGLGTIGSEPSILNWYLVSGSPTIIVMYRCPQEFLSWTYLRILRILTWSDEGFSKFAINLWIYENKNRIQLPKDANQVPSHVPLVRFRFQHFVWIPVESIRASRAMRQLPNFRIRDMGEGWTVKHVSRTVNGNPYLLRMTIYSAKWSTSRAPMRILCSQWRVSFGGTGE
jgi:hypothetical protein